MGVSGRTEHLREKVVVDSQALHAQASERGESRREATPRTPRVTVGIGAPDSALAASTGPGRRPAGRFFDSFRTTSSHSYAPTTLLRGEGAVRPSGGSVETGGRDPRASPVREPVRVSTTFSLFGRNVLSIAGHSHAVAPLKVRFAQGGPSQRGCTPSPRDCPGPPDGVAVGGEEQCCNPLPEAKTSLPSRRGGGPPRSPPLPLS